jgi:hypothetical protein
VKYSGYGIAHQESIPQLILDSCHNSGGVSTLWVYPTFNKETLAMAMNRRLLLLGGMVLGGLISVLPADAGELEPFDIDRLMPTWMIKVMRLTGIDPGGNRVVLMEVPEGVVVPFNDFSGLSSRLIVGSQQSPLAFHSLQAELAPGIFAVDQAGGQVQLANPDRIPRRISLLGAVLKMDDEIRMLGVRPELLRHEVPRSGGRGRECGEREYDD